MSRESIVFATKYPRAGSLGPRGLCRMILSSVGSDDKTGKCQEVKEVVDLVDIEPFIHEMETQCACNEKWGPLR